MRRPQAGCLGLVGNPYLDEMRDVTAGQELTWVEAWQRRHVLAQAYAWAIPSEEALEAIAASGPVVEVGAGSGYWAASLAARGVDVVAYDREPPGSGGPHSSEYGAGPAFFPVLASDAAAAAAAHPDRTLLLCWPPHDNPMAADALIAFREAGGRRVIYVGEPPGGACADERFFDELAKWREADTEAAPHQWPGGYDVVLIYEAR